MNEKSATACVAELYVHTCASATHQPAPHHLSCCIQNPSLDTSKCVIDGRLFEATSAPPLVRVLLKIAGSSVCPLILDCCQVQEKLVAAATAAEEASAQAAAAMAQAEASAAAAQHAQQQLQQVTQEAAARLASQVGCCHRRGRVGTTLMLIVQVTCRILTLRVERAHSSVISGAVLIGCVFSYVINTVDCIIMCHHLQCCAVPCRVVLRCAALRHTHNLCCAVLCSALLLNTSCIPARTSSSSPCRNPTKPPQHPAAHNTAVPAGSSNGRQGQPGSTCRGRGYSSRRPHTADGSTRGRAGEPRATECSTRSGTWGQACWGGGRWRGTCGGCGSAAAATRGGGGGTAVGAAGAAVSCAAAGAWCVVAAADS